MKINPVHIIAAVAMTTILWPDPVDPPAWFHPVKGTIMLMLGSTAITLALKDRSHQ